MADTIKKCTLDVYVKDGRLKEVEEKFDRIKDLFSVELKYGSSQGKQYMVNPGKWLEVVGKRENAVKAREYVKGISYPEEVVRLPIPEPMIKSVLAKITDLEKETAAIISLPSNGEIVEISGWINGVTKAVMNIEQAINVFLEEQALVGADLDQVTTDEQSAGIVLSSDNHNLNVSTDAAIFSPVPPQYYAQNRQYYAENHEDVELAAGKLDASCVTSAGPNQNRCSCGNLNDSPKQTYFYCNNNNNDNRKQGSCTCDTEIPKQGSFNFAPGAASTEPTLTADLMEFGLKLGYSQDEVKSAMKKLGTETAVNQNELLHELIKASTSAKQIGKSDECKVNESTGGYPRPTDTAILRHVVIDGSNVAMSHGTNAVFSCRGIAIAVDWFRKRGHKVTVFVPNWRKEASKPDTPIIDQEYLTQLEKDGVLSYTPSRRIQGKLVQCYDDRYIVKLALETDGVIVSNDNFRDLQEDVPDWKNFIERRLLMYTFANEDIFMPPDDPLGRHGPSLEEFLRTTGEHKLRQCPYGRKCTFGHKCRFYHPERTSHSNALRGKLFPNPALHTLHQQQQQQQQMQGASRPRSDPCHSNVHGAQDNNRRPISLPNLEQLWISNPPGSYVPVGPMPAQNAQGRPVSGPPFQEGQYGQNEQAIPRVCSSGDMMQASANLARRLSGEYTHYSPQQGGQYMHGGMVVNQPRPPSGSDYIGRPLSSDFSSRPPSEDFSYCSGNSRPTSGEFNSSRPNSGDYTASPWNGIGYQRSVSFAPSVHGNQIPYMDNRNFYPIKGYYKNRGPPMPETKEETRIPNGLTRMDLLDKLREMFPNHNFDKILSILRNHPDISSVEDAQNYILNE